MATIEQSTSPTNNTLQTALEAHRAKETAESKLKKPSPHILIIGKSGTGKSRAIKTLPPAQTCVINLENKILPFKEASEFKDTQASGFSFTAEVDRLLNVLKNEPSIKYIVFDSITKYFEMLMIESRAGGGGYEIFNRYNAAIYNLLEACKKIQDKIIIFIGIDELVKDEQPSGALVNRRTLWVEGKVHASKIEKEFSVVIYTDIKVTPGQPPKIEYKFITQTDGVTSAKSPEGMFPREMENDLGKVVAEVEKYFGFSK
jgi:hypothetical protein